MSRKAVLLHVFSVYLKQSFRRKTPPGVSAPSAGLRPLNVSRVKCGGRPAGNTQWPRQGYPHLRLEIISGRNGPCPASRKPSPESSVPGENLNRGSRRNQLRRGHGSPPVLGEVPHELSTAAHSKECKRSPQQFIPAGFPYTTNFPRGRKTQPAPSPHRTWSVPGADCL